jgi:hypothetical protein
MSTWKPPWSAQEQVKLTLLPPTRANNSRVQATSRAGIDGRAAGGLVEPLHPATCPPIWAGPAPDHASARWAEPLVPRPASRAHPYRSGPQRRRTRQAATDPTRPQRVRLARGMARPRRVCPAWVGEQSKHGCAETQWQTRRRRRTDGARLRRNPNLRRGRLHRPALPVQPRSMLRDPPRVGPAGDDPHEATPTLSCRDRWSAQLGHLACLRASASEATVVGDCPG